MFYFAFSKISSWWSTFWFHTLLQNLFVEYFCLSNVKSLLVESIPVSLSNGQVAAGALFWQVPSAHLAVATCQDTLTFTWVTHLLDCPQAWCWTSPPQHGVSSSSPSWQLGNVFSVSWGLSFVDTFSSLFFSWILQKPTRSKVGSLCSWREQSWPMLNGLSTTVMGEDFCVCQGCLIWKDADWAWSQLDWGVTCPLSLSKNQSHWQPEPSAHGALGAALWGGPSSVQSWQEGRAAAAPPSRGAGSLGKRLPQGFHPVAAELIISSQRRKKSEHCICMETSLMWQVQNYSSIYVLWIVLISSSTVPVFYFIFIPSLHWRSLAFKKHLNQISVTFRLSET